MANKIKFDRDEVVHLASELFWEKGFHATSTRDLQETINMRPGSIYAAFGSKEGLYSESLKDYTVQMKTKMDACLEKAGSVVGGLHAFVEDIIIETKDTSPSAICMLVKANSEFAEKESNLHQLSISLATQFEDYLTTLFTQAIANNELNDQLTAIDYARFFQIQFTGLRGYFNRPNVAHLAKPMINQMFVLLKAM
jgi:AcrR family transcriptional regulator